MSASLVSLTDCKNDISCSSSTLQVIFFFSSLYLVAIAQGGHKPCVQAFGADQFDRHDPEEFKSKSSFFNWWCFGVYGGTAVSLSFLNYIQDNLNWVLGFGIPLISMAIALVIFLLGMKSYLYSFTDDKRSPPVRIGQVFVVAVRDWRLTTPAFEEEAYQMTLNSVGSHQFRFLDKALITTIGDSGCDQNVCSITQVEEAKVVLRLVPIWIACLMYAVVFAQSATFFTKQGSTMDRSIGPNFKIPAASLQTLISLSIVLFIPIYDRVLVPIGRIVTGKPSGITMLQRIGCGMFIFVVSMVVAAIIEKKRLQTAIDFGLIDMPKATIPMSVWWLAPQYVLFGISDVFTMVGLQEFF